MLVPGQKTFGTKCLTTQGVIDHLLIYFLVFIVFVTVPLCLVPFLNPRTNARSLGLRFGARGLRAALLIRVYQALVRPMELKFKKFFAVC